MKGDLHCLAKMSTNFQEFFIFGNNLRFLPKFPFKCSENSVTNTLRFRIPDSNFQTGNPHDEHQFLNSWNFFFGLLKKLTKSTFLLLVDFWTTELLSKSVYDVTNQNKTDQNNMISKLTSKSRKSPKNDLKIQHNFPFNFVNSRRNSRKL